MDKMIELKLTLDIVNMILEGLGELPAKKSFQAISEVTAQAQAQLKSDETVLQSVAGE